MLNRRTFIQQVGVFATAIVVSPVLAHCKSLVKKNKIGLQLYSLRHEISKDVKGVIAKVKAAGYADVETYGYSLKDKFWGLDPASFSKLLKSNNLTSFSGHYGMDEYLVKNGTDEKLRSYIEAAAEVDQKYITVPYVAGHIVKDSDGYKQVAEKLNKAAELCKSSGLKLAYHNHDFEFKPTNDGKTGYDILLKETEPALVDFELDLYWVVRAGKDPVTLFNENPGRFAMWHVKDMDKANPKLNTEIGTGSIDFIKILDKAKVSGLKQLFVEQENFSKNPFNSIRESYLYLNDKLTNKRKAY